MSHLYLMFNWLLISLSYYFQENEQQVLSEVRVCRLLLYLQDRPEIGRPMLSTWVYSFDQYSTITGDSHWSFSVRSSDERFTDLWFLFCTFPFLHCSVDIQSFNSSALPLLLMAVAERDPREKGFEAKPKVILVHFNDTIWNCEK